MKVKFKHLDKIYLALLELNKCKMNFQTKLVLRDIQEKIEKEALWFEKQRIELINKYGQKDEQGKLIVQEGNYILHDAEGFKEEFDELLETSVDIPSINTSIINPDWEITGETWEGLLYILERGENVNEG